MGLSGPCPPSVSVMSKGGPGCPVLPSNTSLRRVMITGSPDRPQGPRGNCVIATQDGQELNQLLVASLGRVPHFIPKILTTS